MDQFSQIISENTLKNQKAHRVDAILTCDMSRMWRPMAPPPRRGSQTKALCSVVLGFTLLAATLALVLSWLLATGCHIVSFISFLCFIIISFYLIFWSSFKSFFFIFIKIMTLQESWTPGPPPDKSPPEQETWISRGPDRSP